MGMRWQSCNVCNAEMSDAALSMFLCYTRTRALEIPKDKEGMRVEVEIS